MHSRVADDDCCAIWIGIVGAGTMGVGIAALFAGAGNPVTLVEPDQAVRAHAADRIASRLRGENKPAPNGSVRLASSISELGNVAVVIEAIPEVLDLKKEAYRQLFAVIPRDGIVASNTSSFLPDDLSSDLPDEQAERFTVAHYWHPPHHLRLVEIVPAGRTAAATTQRLRALVASTGSHPIILSRAVPGFIGNRIQFAVLREALHLVELGVADAEMIDEVVRNSLGPRYAVSGPIEAADLGGLQTFEKIATLLWPQLANDAEGLSLLRDRVRDNELGVATGRGFFEWSEQRKRDVADRQARQFRF